MTDNEIVTLEIIPQLLRLKSLLLINNRITRIDDHFADMCPQLESLVLTNNKIAKFDEINKIASTCKQLIRLSLVGNIVSQLPHYRQYVIFKMPQLRVLDFQKVSDKDRQAAKKLFESASGIVILKEMNIREVEVELNIAKKEKKSGDGGLVGSKRLNGSTHEDDEKVLRKIAEIEKLIEQAESLEEV